jgi:hypothetical protein
MNPKYTYEQLLEKLVLAKQKIQQIPGAPHTVSCTSDDPYTGGDCDCGAEKTNKPIRDALELLKIS